jgi:hypothetical protein
MVSDSQPAVKTGSFLWTPAFWLIAPTVLFVVETGLATFYGEEVPRPIESLWMLTFGLALLWWFRIDRRTRSFHAPFEFDAFVFLSWPIAVPCYLCATRGLRGLWPSMGLWILYLLPLLAWIVACIDCE